MANIDTELGPDILDDPIGPGPAPGPRRRGYEPPTPDNGAVGDPRLLVPLALLLAAVFVIVLAWRADSNDDDAARDVVQQSDVVQRVLEAQNRAGFDQITVRENGAVIILEGQAETSTIATAIAAVARSVEGVEQVDNRLVIVGGVIEYAADEPSREGLPSGSLTDQLAAAGDITFEAGLATPTDDGLAIIDAVTAILIAQPSGAIEIHGHTDSDGDTTANEQLSQARAEAVATALAARGIESSRLSAVGFGESQPIAPNITGEGRAKNRRIEFVVAG